MSYREAIILAIVQGLTEFLPVSSSGHLVLLQNWWGQLDDSNLLFDVLLHCATLAAIVLYFRHDLLALGYGLLGRSVNQPSVFAGAERRTIGYVVLASIPTALIGLGIESLGIEVFGRPDIVGLLLIITGLVLWIGRADRASKRIQDMTPKHALVIGIVQGLAVLPGVSRSGSTIAGSLMLGLDRELAVRFSLLISIPAIFGATLLEMTKAFDHMNVALGTVLIGMVTAGVVGYASISLILRLVRQDRFYLFAYYLWPVGLAAILWSYLG